MSSAATKKAPEILDETPTSILLKEYTEKLGSMISKAESSLKEFSHARRLGAAKPDPVIVEHTAQMLDLWKNLRPPAIRLAQYVSSTIEHGRVDQLTELELRLRLAEYENNIRFLDGIVKRFEALGVPR